jgi:ribosomal protein S12 methylthiotransferase
MLKVSIVSLGCPKNLVDSEDLLSNLKNEGFFYTEEVEDADLVFVNTCGFIEEAKRESVEEILKLRHIKEEGKRLLVFGCLAKRYGDELIREIPEIDAIWGVGEEDKIIEYCKEIIIQNNGALEKWRDGELSAASIHQYSNTPGHLGSYAYLKIAEGCSRGCTYCIIPAVRGPYRSLAPDKIMRRAEGYIKSGIKELVLVAQDLGNYGRELGRYNLSSLLRDISSISGDFRIRLLYLNPTSINNELLSVISGEEKICKYLDIPLQHSEERILKAMGRGGSGELYGRTIQKIREAIPGVTLRTTFIVGFPGETEEDFSGLRNFIEDMRFDRLGVFMYSKEEGTPASKMKGNLPKKIKERRYDEIMRIQSLISLEKNKALIGKRLKALIDEVDGNTAIARLCSQAPEIDGVVFIKNDFSRLTLNASRS